MNTNRAVTIKEELELALKDTALIYEDANWCVFVDGFWTTQSESVTEFYRLKESTLTPVHWTA